MTERLNNFSRTQTLQVRLQTLSAQLHQPLAAEILSAGTVFVILHHQFSQSTTLYFTLRRQTRFAPAHSQTTSLLKWVVAKFYEYFAALAVFVITFFLRIWWGITTAEKSSTFTNPITYLQISNTDPISVYEPLGTR